MKIIAMPVGILGANSYIIYHEITGDAVVIDPGGDGETILGEISSRELEVKYILLTHGHFDHIHGVGSLKERTGAKVAIHKEDAGSLGDIHKNLSSFMGVESVQPEADIMLEHGQRLEFGDIILKIIHTPGHSPGSICLRFDNIVFTGDTLFKGSIGRTDLVGGELGQILGSIKDRLLTLDDGTIVYPGHGPMTTIGDEKLTNQFLRGLI
ncbi:MAG TPA: MBL fold metallo-hydrolase [Clostridia bacterium]|nr:MBL fold metallo-hydrolase [Clostridia bacterium]